MAYVPRFLELWTTGDFNETWTEGVDRSQEFLAQTYLVKKDGDDYAHAYIAEVCRYTASDVIQCGVLGEGDAPALEYVANGFSVTFGLRTTGGAARSGIVIWRLT